MANSRFPRTGDKVKILNSKKHKDRIFTVKQGLVLFDRHLAVVLREIRGYYNIKNLQIVEENNNVCQ